MTPESPIRVAWVRGSYLNRFEGQNYRFPPGIDITGVSSWFPLDHRASFPVTALPSFADIGYAPVVKFIPGWTRLVNAIGNRILGDSQVLWGLDRVLADIDIAHTADPHYGYSYQLAVARKTGALAKLIVTSWETIPHNNESLVRKKAHKYAVLESADRCICYTAVARDVLLAEGVDKHKIDVVPLGVDLDRFRPTAGGRRSRILFVGRLVPEKGILDLYDACRRLPKSSLTIVGDGPLRGELLRRIRADGLGERISLRTATYDEMPGVYANADVFVLPSVAMPTWEEQYGMVLAEAMACGLPVIATDSGAIAEVVGDAAMLVMPGNPTQLTEAIGSVTADEKLARGLADRSLARARTRFDSRRTAAILGTIYRKVYRL